MKIPALFKTVLAAIAAVFLVTGTALGQGNLTNTGSWVNTGTLTVNNFTNQGASASFANSGGSSILRIKGALTTTSSGAVADSFNVTAGEVRYMGNLAQSINSQVRNNTYANLSTTGAGASTKSLGGNITVSNTITSDGAGVVIDVGANTLTVSGTGNPIASANSGAFTFTSGTVNYAASGAQNIFTANYGTLGVTAAGNKTMQGNDTILTALNLSAGNLQINGNTLVLNGGLNSAGGALEGGATSNLTFNGSGSATLPGVTNGLATLIVNRSGATDTVHLSGNLALATSLTLSDGDLRVGSGTTLTLNSGSSRTSGTLSSASDGTVSYSQSSGGQSVLAANYGNLSFSNFTKALPAATVRIAGTFTPGNATGHTIAGNTIEFNGGAQSVPGFNGTTGYQNLVTSGLGTTKTAGDSIFVAGNFTNGDSVTTNMQTYALNVTGSRSQASASSKMQFGGQFNGRLFTTGIVEYNGANQTIAGDAALKYATLLLSGSGTKTVASGAANTVHTSGNLTINSGITLSVVSGAALNVDLDLFNNGSVNNAGTITIGN